MNGGGLVVEWRGRSFLVDLAPGGVSVTEAGAPATSAAREAVIDWKVLDLADTLGFSSGLAPALLLGVAAAILDRRGPDE